MSTHADWADSAAAYVLGALPPAEVDGFREHMAGCPDCRRAVEELRAAADALPMSTQQLTPPPALKGRIMAVVESEAELLAASGAGADRPPKQAPRRKERRAWWARPGLALGAVVLALAGGALAGGLLTGEPTRTIAATTEPQGSDVTLQVSGDAGTLVVRDMPPPPEGRIYQVWVKRPGQDPAPTDALWSVNAQGDAQVAVPGSLDGVEAVLVTDEPQGGSEAPTTTPVIQASPA